MVTSPSDHNLSASLLDLPDGLKSNSNPAVTGSTLISSSSITTFNVLTVLRHVIVKTCAPTSAVLYCHVCVLESIVKVDTTLPSTANVTVGVSVVGS